jgi:hypothetical protein
MIVLSIQEGLFQVVVALFRIFNLLSNGIDMLICIRLDDFNV